MFLQLLMYIFISNAAIKISIVIILENNVFPLDKIWRFLHIEIYKRIKKKTNSLQPFKPMAVRWSLARSHQLSPLLQKKTS